MIGLCSTFLLFRLCSLSLFTFVFLRREFSSSKFSCHTTEPNPIKHKNGKNFQQKFFSKLKESKTMIKLFTLRITPYGFMSAKFHAFKNSFIVSSLLLNPPLWTLCLWMWKRIIILLNNLQVTLGEFEFFSCNFWCNFCNAY